jgi:hypothetical protein
MIVVIQCAGTKRSDAGRLRTRAGIPVEFVGIPEMAPPSPRKIIAHPDGTADDGRPWRDHLVDYNSAGMNPLGLCKAFELYEPPAAPDVYRRLVGTLGIANVFVLSAGWGLIRADFLTPFYDITFASDVRRSSPWKRRRRGDRYNDFRHLVEPLGSEVFFVGGKSYVPLFCALTAHLDAPRAVFYNSNAPPRAPGCALRRFETHKKMNWQYDCAGAILREWEG